MQVFLEGTIIRKYKNKTRQLEVNKMCGIMY